MLKPIKATGDPYLSRGQTRPVSNAFFADKKEWSERKHNVLMKYLVPAMRILASIKPPFYIDGFAGEGMYGSGPTATAGSPVKAAKYAIECESGEKRYTFKCINVEEDRDALHNLEEHTRSYANLVTNLHGTFEQHVPRILDMIKGSPALFFLDPFGVVGVYMDTVRKCVRRGDPTDLWIRFDHRVVARLAGYYVHGAEKQHGKFITLARHYGIEDPQVLHEHLAGSSPKEREARAVRLYLEQLSATFPRGAFTAAYPIRTIDGIVKYYMVFATAHPKGAVLASNVIYNAEETYELEAAEYRDSGDVRQLTLWAAPTAEDIFRAKVSRITSDLQEKCQGKTVKRRDAIVRILPQWFGKMGTRHITAALRALHADGKIVVVEGTLGDDNCTITFARDD